MTCHASLSGSLLLCAVVNNPQCMCKGCHGVTKQPHLVMMWMCELVKKSPYMHSFNCNVGESNLCIHKLSSVVYVIKFQYCLL